MKKIKGIDNKIRERCKECDKKLPIYNPHHELCENCWILYKESKGNFCPHIISGFK